MATATVVAVEARCPLCGAEILSIGRGGRVEAEDLHPVPLYRTRHAGEAYMVCEECSVLTRFPEDITLN